MEARELALEEVNVGALSVLYERGARSCIEIGSNRSLESRDRYVSDVKSPLAVDPLRP